MLEILTMLGIGFDVGLTGALVPGPMLFATIETWVNPISVLR